MPPPIEFNATKLQEDIRQLHHRHRPVLINLWAPPGVGKSTTMAAIFNTLKHRGARAEMSPEVAKVHTYENNRMALCDQLYVTAAQEYRNFMLIGQVDYIVTDSPPPLSILYCEEPDEQPLFDMTAHYRKRYRNIDVRLTRDPTRPFQTHGRNQTEGQSRALEGRLDAVLRRVTNNVFTRVADRAAPEAIIKFVDEEVLHHAW